ncbi:MAG: hypothetical protein K0Q60_4700 [Microvirga sp.]|nr:hypothetical protein [Microvirga sp.]
MVLVGLLALFLVAFTVATILRSNVITRSGEIPYLSGGDTNIYYGLKYLSPPQLSFKADTSITFSLKHQDVDHFVINIRSYLVGAPNIRWTATGSVLSSDDPRSTWESFSTWQQLFSITALLALIGLIADMIGIYQYLSQRSK